jgi:hypothetical protein
MACWLALLADYMLGNMAYLLPLSPIAGQKVSVFQQIRKDRWIFRKLDTFSTGSTVRESMMFC